MLKILLISILLLGMSGCTFHKLLKITITGDKLKTAYMGIRGDNVKALLTNEIYWSTDKEREVSFETEKNVDIVK